MKQAHTSIKLIFLMPFLILAMGCSETEFNKKESESLSYEVRVGQLEIMFVDDNSGSMSEEQRRMADGFPSLIQGLDIAGVDYRIGIITTDVQSKDNPLVNDGVLQNGNLLQFPNGEYFLTPESSNIESQFAQTIQRQETIDCERSGFNSESCASEDERGIYAAYLAVNANKRDFFRENGHVAFVFLSDEDVRGTGFDNHPFRQPEALDYPVNLINAVKTRLGKNTDISAHAIITDTESCKSEQLAQGGNENIHGVIGNFYKTFANPQSAPLIGAQAGETLADYAGGQLVQGTVGSICANDYTKELGNIKDVLTKGKSVENLKCQIFEEETLVVRVDSNHQWELNDTKDAIKFSPPLPPGKSFKLEYECF